jgi:hypothetical protein
VAHERSDAGSHFASSLALAATQGAERRSKKKAERSMAALKQIGIQSFPQKASEQDASGQN